jgi:hypothetical protein
MDGTPGFEIQLMDAGKRPMFVVSMVGFNEEQAHDKALELLSLHGGESFIVKPRRPSLT